MHEQHTKFSLFLVPCRANAHPPSAHLLCMEYYLSPREIALTLLRVSGNTLLGILALEAKLLQLALDRQRLGERHLRTRLHRPFNTTDRLRSAVRRAEAARVLHHPIPVVLLLVNVIDQPQFVR